MKIWFITGTSRGFGREWAKAALARGDKVAATARNTATLKDLVSEYGKNILPIKLDVTDRKADFAAVKEAYDHFGRLDVVINNAGYGLFGTIEEVTEAQARTQMETNFFGALWVTQAALPYFRMQRSGHVLHESLPFSHDARLPASHLHDGCAAVAPSLPRLAQRRRI